MYVVLFVTNMPDNCGAFFSDITLAKALQKFGHQVCIINCGHPKNNFSGGIYEGLKWKP
jgi:glycosyltransferase involved in cell wall biosynthesis